MPATIVFDALWGDSGKGKISAYLALRDKVAFPVRAGTRTNAGHSIYFGDGTEIRTHQLPCGWLHPDTQLRVRSGLADDPDIFISEVNTYALSTKARVDIRCPIITEEYRRKEQEDPHLVGIVGSVCRGTGVARSESFFGERLRPETYPSLPIT